MEQNQTEETVEDLVIEMVKMENKKEQLIPPVQLLLVLLKTDKIVQYLVKCAKTRNLGAHVAEMEPSSD